MESKERELAQFTLVRIARIAKIILDIKLGVEYATESSSIFNGINQIPATIIEQGLENMSKVPWGIKSNMSNETEEDSEVSETDEMFQLD